MNLKFWQLSGFEILTKEAPSQCGVCSCDKLYQQNDFKRSIGLTIISLCSLSTFWLLYEGYGWFTVWSPMLLALFVDRGLNYLTPLAVICYRCGAVYRGLEKKLVLQKFDSFDLEVYDRVNYGNSETS